MSSACLGMVFGGGNLPPSILMYRKRLLKLTGVASLSPALQGRLERGPNSRNSARNSRPSGVGDQNRATRITRLCASSRTSRKWFPVLVDFKVAGRAHAEKVSNEIVPPSPHQIQIATFAVIHVGNDEHVEVLVGLNKRVGKPHRLDNVDVIIDVAVLDQQPSLEPVGHRDVRLFGIVGPHRESLIELVPPGLIQSRIVISGDGNTNFIKIRKYQHGMSSAVRSGG